MFLEAIDRASVPVQACWDNETLFWNGAYYAMFNIATARGGVFEGGYAVDIHQSEDGVHWRRVVKDAMPLPSAHAGFSVHRFGDVFYYHPTCTTQEKGIHFKTYRSFDMLRWEHMGDEFDVMPDKRWYRQRWDEMQVLDDEENGRKVYYGYISSEVRDDVGEPSCGLLKSYDGLHWEVDKPPVIVWGRIPAQHMEVSFCVKFQDKYYLCLNGRLYLDSLGYSLFTFVADKPEGPFYPDVSMFRLCGNSNTEYTWLSHTIHAPSGLLCATWLSKDQIPSIPSRSFAISPFMRLCADDGHLRMAYWQGNNASKNKAYHAITMTFAHPMPKAREERDVCLYDGHTLQMNAWRDGVISCFDQQFDHKEGFVIEGDVLVRENRTPIETHHHAAWFGVLIYNAEHAGTAMVASTHASCVTGSLRYADAPVCDHVFFDDRNVAQDLHTARSGRLRGLLSFDVYDTLHAIGQASAPDLRHNKPCSFRLMVRRDFFQLYINDFYVQTGAVPDGYTGRIGLAALDGFCTVSNLHVWSIALNHSGNQYKDPAAND